MGVAYGISPTWAAQTDEGRTHIATRGIVQDGLVLNLDAGASISYPGSGTTWTDLSGNGNNGTLVNGVGYSNGALVFDGVNDYVTCNPKNSTTNGLYFGGATSISVSAWVKNNTTNTFNNFVMYEDIVNGNGVEPVRLATRGHVGDNTASFSIAQSDSSNSAISNTILNDTDYYHLTGTFGGGYVKIYVNGIFESQTSLSGSMDVPISGTSARWTIGSGELDSSRFLNGNIAQVSIYNRALTAEEIQQNFNATKSRFQ